MKCKLNIKFNNNGAMKKYSSYVDLKLQSPTYYNPKQSAVNSPTFVYSSNLNNVSSNKLSSTPKSPSFKRTITYDNPIMMLSKQNIYGYNGTMTPNSSKYSGAYKKKISINQKQKIDKTKNRSQMQIHQNSKKQNYDHLNKETPINSQKYSDGYSYTSKSKKDGKKSSESKNKKSQRESKQKIEKNTINSNATLMREKATKLSDLDIKQYLANKVGRLDVQSPKSTETFFKNTQKEKQKEREEKIKNRLKQKKNSNKNLKELPPVQKKIQVNQEEELEKYITKYQLDNKPVLAHCTSETYLLPNQLRPLSTNIGGQAIKSRYYVQSLYSAFYGSNSTNPTKLSTFQQISRNHLQTSIEFLTYARKNKHTLIPSNPHKIVQLPNWPKSKHKNTIIFDLDQTLIHCNQSLDLPHDIQVQIVFPNNSKIKAGINIRQYAIECLKELSQYYQIIIFTASHQCYANKIIDYLDPQRKYVAHRMFREDCYKTKQGFYVKDLRVLNGCRNLQNVLLVDNAAYSYCFQPANGVPIIPFYNNKTDWELREIVRYLKGFVNDTSGKAIRQLNQERMKLSLYYKYRDPKQLINQLYL